MGLIEKVPNLLENTNIHINIHLVGLETRLFIFGEEQDQTCFLVNLKLNDDLDSGDVVGVSIILPRYFTEKKNSFKANLEAPFSYSKSCRKRLKKIISTREKKQKALMALFDRVWYNYYFVAKVIHFCFSKVKDKRVVDSFFKIIKVGFGLFFQAFSPNCIGFYLLLELGKFYRRKALYFLIRAFKRKFKRLAPKRRMHRKKRKNK